VIYPGVVLVDTTGIFVQSHEGIVPFTLSPSTNKLKSFLFKRWWSQNDSEKPSLPLNPSPQMITFFAWVWTFACLHGKEGNIFLSPRTIAYWTTKGMETAFYLSCIATCTSFQPRSWMLKGFWLYQTPSELFIYYMDARTFNRFTIRSCMVVWCS
jgi:hypothetical protein